MNDEPGQHPSGRAIARRDLEIVIRRAAELSQVEGDADERLSEAEVVRIAAELGLEPRHVRQALYEMPALRPAPSWTHRYYGSPIVTSARVVPGDVRQTARRLEDYLTTREYLQIVRRQREQLLLAPAEDAISSIARGLLRSSNRHYLARARRVLLTVHPLDDAHGHVLVEADLDDQRRTHFRTGATLGGIAGLAVGAGFAAAIEMALAPGVATAVGQVIAFGGGVGAGLTAGILSAAARFRTRIVQARNEIDALLDRAERGERLEPPPAPWRRRLQQRFFGDR